MSYSIEFNEVSFRYEGADQDALKDVSFRIEPGEIVLLTGPAGSGKTTLCSCANALIPHYHEGELRGEVLIGPYRTKKARIGGLSSIVGLVFQDPESQIVTATVADEVAFGPENLGISREEIHGRVASALEATRLSGFEDRDPHSLSGGEQQATVIAAIYAMHPEIYVMDEPLANLDPQGRTRVMKLIVEVAKRRGKTLLLVEHALEEVLPLVQRVMVIEAGRIVRDGPVRDVLQAGDIPGVFTRPAFIRLAEESGLERLPLSPQEFIDDLMSSKDLKSLDGAAPEAGTDPEPVIREPVIEVEGLHYAYDTGTVALNGVDLTVADGEMVAILGQNGSGKTTLVRNLIGLITPERGRVTVLGHDVTRTATHELARSVGFCFQNPNHQLVTFNVRDEIAFGLEAHGIEPGEFETRTRQALQFVGMLDQIDAELFDLGKGQRQRLALASVIALDPRILVIDEPTTGQDARMAVEIFDILRRLNDRGTTILLITHKIGLAATYAKRAIVLRDGRVDFDGSFRRLLMDVDLVKLNSLELPHITQIARILEPYGVPPWLASYDELAAAVRAMTGDCDGN